MMFSFADFCDISDNCFRQWSDISALLFTVELFSDDVHIEIEEGQMLKLTVQGLLEDTAKTFHRDGAAA